VWVEVFTAVDDGVAEGASVAVLAGGLVGVAVGGATVFVGVFVAIGAPPPPSSSPQALRHSASSVSVRMRSFLGEGE
jgi:hypothetical protein